MINATLNHPAFCRDRRYNSHQSTAIASHTLHYTPCLLNRQLFCTFTGYPYLPLCSADKTAPLKESRLCNDSVKMKEMFLVFFFRYMAAAAIPGAACAVTGTVSAIRTANALDTLFLFLADIQEHRAENQKNNHQDQIIDRFHRQLLTVQGVFLLFS